MKVPKDLLYTRTHEWVRMEGGTAVVGITDFAQDQLSDLTFVELPGAGDAVAAGQEVAVVESVKAASDIYAPLAGTVSAVNEGLAEHPERVNSDPYGEGWLFAMKVDDPGAAAGLLSAGDYERQLPAGD